MGALLATAKTFFAGINLTALFYKLLVYVGLVVLIATVSYREGKSDCQKSALAEQITLLEKTIIIERQTIVKELERRQTVLLARLEIIGAHSKEAAKLKQDLNQIKGDLYEAINARPASDACAPTADELSHFDSIADRTRTTP